MRSFLLLLALAAAAHALPSERRLARQVWSFPDDEDQPPMPPARPQTRPTQPAPTRQTTRTTTTSQQGESTTPPPSIVFVIPNCPCPATPQYNPVCGTNGVTYVNRQKLNCASQCGVDVQLSRLGVCATPRK